MFRIQCVCVLLLLTLFSSCNRTGKPSSTKTYGPREYKTSHCQKHLLLDLTEEEEKKELYKVLLINQRVFVKSLPSFMIDFTRGLEAKGWHIFDTSKMQGSMKEDLFRKTGVDRYPDIVAIYNAEEEMFRKWPQFFSEDMKNSVLIHWPDEVHHPNHIDGMKISLSITDAIFPRYHHAALRVLEPEHPRCFQMPHAATKNFFKEIRKDKTETVLLSGATEPMFYPLRRQANILLVSGNPHIVLRTHPGYQYRPDPDVEAQDYAEEISKHLMAISGGGFEPALPGPFLYAKHFEIPAAGTALITDEEMIPYLSEYGFKARHHYIATSRANLEASIYYWLAPENREELMRITKRGQELVRKLHRNEQRIETFDRNAVNLFHEKNRN